MNCKLTSIKWMKRIEFEIRNFCWRKCVFTALKPHNIQHVGTYTIYAHIGFPNDSASIPMKENSPFPNRLTVLL